VSGFVDPYRMAMGWWSSPEIVIVHIGAVTGTVRVYPRITGSIYTLPRISGTMLVRTRTTGDIGVCNA